MRNRFVLVVLVPALFVGIITALFIDSWVESGLEYAAERVVKAKVEIDGLELSLYPVGLSWDRLQVTDPGDTWSNLFETRRVAFQMDAGQLLRAKFVIDTIRVDGLVFGTQRSSDGALPVSRDAHAGDGSAGSPSFSAQAEQELASNRTSAPMFDLGRIRKELNIDSLTNPRNLETFRRIDSLKASLSAAESEWTSSLQEIQSTKERIAEIEQRVRSINVGAINSVQAAQQALTTAQEAYAGTRGVIQTLDQRRTALSGSVNGFAAQIRTIDDAARRDFDRVISAAKLPDVSMKGLAQLVLGKDILDRATEYLGYVDLARTTIPKYTPKPDPDQPRRSEGVMVHFPEERSYPKLWIREIVVSGGEDSARRPEYFYASGRIRNITNNQRLTGEPLTADLEATKGLGTRATISAAFDRRADEPHDRYQVDVQNIRVGDMSLGSSSFLPSKVSDAVARAEISVDVPGNRLQSSAKVSFGSLRIQFDREPSGAVERLTRDVLASVQGFFVSLRLWRRDTGALDVAFETDLDDQLASRARSVIGAEVARIRNEIRQRVDAQIAAKRQELERMYAMKKAEVQTRLNAIEKEIRDKVSFIEAKTKELEDRVEQEKKKAEDALKKKAGDALKGILRKNE